MAKFVCPLIICLNLLYAGTSADFSNIRRLEGDLMKRANQPPLSHQYIGLGKRQQKEDNPYRGIVRDILFKDDPPMNHQYIGLGKRRASEPPLSHQYLTLGRRLITKDDPPLNHQYIGLGKRVNAAEHFYPYKHYRPSLENLYKRAIRRYLDEVISGDQLEPLYR